MYKCHDIFYYCSYVLPNILLVQLICLGQSLVVYIANNQDPCQLLGKQLTGPPPFA